MEGQSFGFFVTPLMATITTMADSFLKRQFIGVFSITEGQIAKHYSSTWKPDGQRCLKADVSFGRRR